MCARIKKNCFFGVRCNYSDAVGVRKGEMGVEEDKDACHSIGERECGVKFGPGERIRVED